MCVCACACSLLTATPEHTSQFSHGALVAILRIIRNQKGSCLSLRYRNTKIPSQVPIRKEHTGREKILRHKWDRVPAERLREPALSQGRVTRAYRRGRLEQNHTYSPPPQCTISGHSFPDTKTKQPSRRKQEQNFPQRKGRALDTLRTLKSHAGTGLPPLRETSIIKKVGG